MINPIEVTTKNIFSLVARNNTLSDNIKTERVRIEILDHNRKFVEISKYPQNEGASESVIM